MLKPYNDALSSSFEQIGGCEYPQIEFNSDNNIQKVNENEFVDNSSFSHYLHEEENKKVSKRNENKFEQCYDDIVKVLPSSRYTKWTKQEDIKLKELVLQLGTKNWEKIIENFKNKSISQCIYRWYKVVKPSIRNEEWLAEEDSFLERYISEFGTKSWTNCSKIMNTGRTAKNCKERWYNVLSLRQKTNNFFSPKDDLFILILVQNFGTCWSKIIKFFQNKKENQIKNRCYSILRKYAIDHLNNNGKISRNLKGLDLKATQIVSFLQTAIEGLKRIVGQEAYKEVIKEFKTNKQVIMSSEDPDINSECTNSIPCITSGNQNMIYINLCNNCKSKLKEQIKKKIYTKMIQNQINSFNSQPVYQNVMNKANTNTTISNENSHNNLEILDSFNTRLKNTGLKVESIKEMLKNFIENAA